MESLRGRRHTDGISEGMREALDQDPRNADRGLPLARLVPRLVLKSKDSCIEQAGQRTGSV